MRKLSDQRGIAAVTVLLVTAVMVVAGTVVVLTATSELQIGAGDRRAEDAFAAAEAGLDQAARHLFEQPTWASAQTYECLNNPLVNDAVEYDDPDPSVTAPCGVQVTSPSNGRWTFPGSGKPFIDYTAISRAQEGRTAFRTLVARYHLESLDIPYGMFIDGNIDLNGTPGIQRESLLVNGTVTTREKLSFDWNGNGLSDDPDLGWRFHQDLIKADPGVDQCFDGETNPPGNVGCAAVYANFQIFDKNQQKNSDEEHYPCTADCDRSTKYPRDRDVHNTAYDGMGVPYEVVNIPPENILEPMPELKNLAQSQGLYFNFKDGKADNIQLQPADINAATTNFEKNVVVYIEADASDDIGWKINLIPEDPSSDMQYMKADGTRTGSLSGVIVVRGGGLRLEAGTVWHGAIFVPEGTLRILGGCTFVGTIYAKGFTAQGGGSTVKLEPSWFTRLPSGFVEIVRQAFYECERYQASPVCPQT